MTLEVEVIMPKGYDPDGPNASREEYARLMAAEARELYSSIERFVVIFATIRDQNLHVLLGYKTINEFAHEEYGVSKATAHRWVEQGRAIAELGPAEAQVGLAPREDHPDSSGRTLTAPVRVTDEARLSQREAARRAKQEREEAEAETRRAAREAQEAARKAKREAEERRRAEVEAAEPEVLVARPVAPRQQPKPERVALMSARETLNRLLGIIESVDDARLLVSAATAAERSTIAAFGALFARKPIIAEVVSEKDCPHPPNRRLGKDCGACGARNVGGKK